MQSDAPPTLVDLPPASSAERAAAHSATLSRTLDRTLPLPAPETVLHSAELEQTRRTGVAGMVFNPIGFAVSHLLQADPVALRVMWASFLLGALNNAWLWYASTNERRYRSWKVTLYFIAAPVLNVGVLYGFGVFGPMLVVFVFNIYASCLGTGERSRGSPWPAASCPCSRSGARTPPASCTIRGPSRSRGRLAVRCAPASSRCTSCSRAPFTRRRAEPVSSW